MREATPESELEALVNWAADDDLGGYSVPDADRIDDEIYRRL